MSTTPTPLSNIKVGDYVRVPDRIGILGVRYARVHKHYGTHLGLAFWIAEKGRFADDKFRWSTDVNEFQACDEPVEKIEGGTLAIMARVAALGFADDARKQLRKALERLNNVAELGDAEIEDRLDEVAHKLAAARKAIKSIRS